MSELMPFEEGNRFWELRSSHGRNPKFEKPEDLWDAACEYFEWVENNPLQEDRPFAYQGVVIHEPVNKMRAMTLDGLELFLDIVPNTWLNYKKKDDFLQVTTRIEQVIKSQKFAGAAAELLNPNIIARDLGLAEKQEIKGDVHIDRKEWIK